MPLNILKEKFLDSLIASIPQNEAKYKQDKQWLNGVAGPGKWNINTGLEPAEPIKLVNPDGDDLKDYQNAIIIHRALGFLTPLQARDPRLWTYLSHVDCWPYMRKRWPIERMGSNTGKAQKFIASRYIITQNQSRALTRHGIARLWWYTRLTHDSDRANPYELTGVLLGQLDIAQQLLERSYGRVPQLLTGFLDFLLHHRDDLLGPGEGKRPRIRHLAKFLNQYGGVTLLDCLTRTEIIDRLEGQLATINKRPELIEA
jgi:hypothetical protein